MKTLPGAESPALTPLGKKKILLEELAQHLNSVGSGATKTPEKWLKCWQDWKSDVKAKSLKIRKARAGTGGGPSPAPLSPLEENLLQFFGVEMVEGLPGVVDPLQVSEAVTTSPIIEVVTMEEMVSQEESNVQSTQQELRPQESRQKSNNDPLHNILNCQAAAIEDVAAGIQEIASALRQIAAVLQPLHSCNQCKHN